ncbi:hypothetical protein M3226_29550 [Neobacillus cucumis]|uniref:hypothetical protein n=1 Tax=Neobacillus cucumis TaxID=1740721 RepID=UPI00203CB61D|nr:hypothetical protein [Neobacillus cucumis]MCM3729716.1 hypothetical protein [Neobacillus cucumis]
MKNMIVIFTILLMFSTDNLVNAKKLPEPKEIKPYAEDRYVTPEDIVLDIIFPAIDKRVIKEYGDGLFSWQSQRIVGIVYNNNHSYDVSVRLQVPDERNVPGNYAQDLVRVRVSPSCDSPKIGCSHGFKVEVLEYKHESK